MIIVKTGIQRDSEREGDLSTKQEANNQTNNTWIFKWLINQIQKLLELTENSLNPKALFHQQPRLTA